MSFDVVWHNYPFCMCWTLYANLEAREISLYIYACRSNRQSAYSIPHHNSAIGQDGYSLKPAGLKNLGKWVSVKTKLCTILKLSQVCELECPLVGQWSATITELCEILKALGPICQLECSTQLYITDYTMSRSSAYFWNSWLSVKGNLHVSW